MKHKVWFLWLIKLKYTTTDKHQIATGYSNFLTQFSASLNNLMCAYISIIIIVIAITIIIIILFLILLLLLLLLYYDYCLIIITLCYQLLPGKQYHKVWDQHHHRTIGELKLLTFYHSF